MQGHVIRTPGCTAAETGNRAIGVRLVHQEAFKKRFEPIGIDNEIHILVDTENSPAVRLRQYNAYRFIVAQIAQIGGNIL